MKPIFTIVVFLSLSFNIFSQTDDTETQRKHIEVGVDASSFVKNFTSFGNEAGNTISPYTFHFKLVNNINALRVHFGFNTAITQSDINGFTESNNILGNCKIGYEKRTLASKRWMILYGIDGLINIQLNKNSSVSFEEVDIKRQDFGFGLSPFIGFAFNLTPKVYLSSEASLEGIYTTRKVQTIFSDPSIPDQTDFSNSFRISTKLPTNLSFTVKF